MSDMILRERVPAHTIGGIDRYVEKHINDLREALGRADSTNREALFDIVSYIYNECPFQCWGSPEKVGLWLGEITIEPEQEQA
jgi:hypothetical protein